MEVKVFFRVGCREILVAFDNNHTDGCIAKRIMDAPLEHALEQMSKTLIPASNMKAIVDAQRCVDDAPEKEVETNEAMYKISLACCSKVGEQADKKIT